MLSCRDVTARASLIIDGKLPPKERFGVRVHLLICSHCRRFVKQLRALTGAMRLRAEQRETATVPDEAFQARLVNALLNAPAAGNTVQPHSPAPPGNPHDKPR